MPSPKTYCTDAELADLKSDTEGATLYINPPLWAPSFVTLGTLVKHAMEVLTTVPGQRSVEIELRQGCCLNSDQIRWLAESTPFQDGS